MHGYDRTVIVEGAGMSKINTLMGFIPRTELSTVTDTTPLNDVLHQLSGDIKGIILADSNHPTALQGYVSGHELLNLVKSGEWLRWKDRELSKLIRDPQVKLSMTPMANNIIHETDATRFLPTAENIARVVGAANNTVGFIFPDKLMHLHVPIKVYWCTNPENAHANAQLGRCGACPFPVAA